MKKLFKTPDYHQIFDTETGVHVYWGSNPEENPAWCQYGPSILDLEISSGYCKGSCPFCYKDNGTHCDDIENMSLNTFKQILAKMNKEVLTQIAFGLCDIDSNPDMWAIFEHSRSENIIPNFTCNGLGITQEVAEKASRLCGAVAVSLVNKEHSYNAINMFTDAGMKQVNIHFMLSEETFEKALTVLHDIKNDARLKDLNAIVFLQYKPKGHSKGKFHSLKDSAKFDTLLNIAKEQNIKIGFDSCSAPLYLKSISEDKDFDKLSMFADPCESGLFSSYINVFGQFFPCSFAEGVAEWKHGLDVLSFKSFQDLWKHERLSQWRSKLLSSSSSCNCKAVGQCRSCPIYPSVTACKENK